jgi:hypothetical protein
MKTPFASLLGIALATQAVHAQPRPADWRLRKLFDVGVEPDTTTLARVRSIQLTNKGRLLVVDAQAQAVHVFDSTGRAQALLGRVGSGPAEYRTPYSIAIIGDTIAVLDPGNGRIGLFDQAGSWRGSWIVQPVTGGSAIRLYRVPGREFYAIGTRATSTGLITTYVRYDGRGARDTLVPTPVPQAPDFGVRCAGTDKGIRFFSTPLQPSNIRLPGPGATILDAKSDVYRIVQKSAAGMTLRTFVGAPGRVPIADAEWDSAGAELAAYLQKDPNAECSKRALVRPPSKPTIRAYWWDDAGRLWVERFAMRGFVFDVFNDQGVLVATLPAPDRVSSVEPSVVGNRIALLSATPDGVHFVQVYRILYR